VGPLREAWLWIGIPVVVGVLALVAHFAGWLSLILPRDPEPFACYVF